jgi:uncharacterized protein YgiM (DUF1202 family)
MNPKPRMYLMFVFLVVASLACSLSDLTGQATATQDPGSLDTAVAKSLAETASIQTAIAQGVASVAAPTQGGSSAGGPTLEVQSSLTPSLTVSPTSGKAMVSVSNATNCRSGPGTVYDWLGALNPGQEVEILGKDPSNSSYYIKNPTNSSGFCWIWNTYATVTGDMAAVPVYTPMPTPTPAKTSTPTLVPADFTVVFEELTVCGNYYFEFRITNTGSLIWQSYEATVNDTVASVYAYGSKSDFIDYTGCAETLVQHDLAPGETGRASAGPINNPTGHLINAIIKLCSLDGSGGTCISKSLIFTP